MPPTRRLTTAEEIANAATHGVGLVASVIGTPLLLLAAFAGGERLRIAGAIVFATTLVGLYAASTLYHAIPAPRAKQALQLVDHVAIYLLIAGTYTPFTLGVLRGAWGWTLFGIVWGLAALGTVFKLVFRMRFPRLSTLIYVAMGWLAVVAIRPLAASLPGPGLALLVAGGLLYTVGVIFFLAERARFSHTVWHCFVLAGSACHYVAVLRYATG